MDILGSAAGILIMLPFLPCIALAIKMETEGPVFVRLKRVSRGRTFDLYKFRTMIANAEAMKPALLARNERADGPFFKMRSDPRITRVGKILRRFRIDEWPQFMNALRGDISLVGPRPYEPKEVAAYPKEYRHLPRAQAGITGLSQTSGSSQLSFMKTLELDDWYLKNRTLALDMRITLRTALIAAFDHGAI